MTMPKERTRALRWVGEFLRECSKRELPKDLDCLVDRILDDYPTNEIIQYAAENGSKMDFGGWLQPEDYLDDQSMKAWEQGVMKRMQRMHTDEAFRLKIAKNLS